MSRSSLSLEPGTPYFASFSERFDSGRSGPVILVAFKELLVFLEKGSPVLAAGHFRIRDIVPHGYEPGDDLVSRFPGCRFADGMKLRHYLVQIADRDLCSVNELECAPANCRRVRINSSNSSADLKKRHDTLLKIKYDRSWVIEITVLTIAYHLQPMTCHL